MLLTRCLIRVKNPFNTINYRQFSETAKYVNFALNENNKIGIATLQNPPVNSLNLELLTELSHLFNNLEKKNINGLILTSSSKNVFCAGLDIMEMYKPNLDRCRQFWTTLQDVWIKLYGCSYPTVAVINGHAPAGGCLLSLSCEYRIMLENFTIGLNETQLGIVAPKWFIASLHNTISKRQSELALTKGKLFTTDEALTFGLIDEISSNKDDALNKAMEFIKSFSRIPPLARAMTKQSLRQKSIDELIDNREQDLNNFLTFVSQDNVQKGLEKYLELLKKKQ